MHSFEMPYCLPGCVGPHCNHRLPDTSRIEEHSERTNPTLRHCPAPFTVTYTTPNCTKELEREQFRVSVFDAANQAIVHAGDSCNTLRGKLNAEHQAWNLHARRWWDGPCPFYASGLLSDGS